MAHKEVKKVLVCVKSVYPYFIKNKIYASVREDEDGYQITTNESDGSPCYGYKHEFKELKTKAAKVLYANTKS